MISHPSLARLVAAGALSFATTVGVAPTGTAAADPLNNAQAQAAQLRVTVSALQVQAEQASEKYDAAEASLYSLIAEQRTAEKKEVAARTVVAANQALAADRARVLYISGGSAAAYASVLSGADPVLMMTAMHDLQSLSDADNHALATIDGARRAATRAEHRVNALLQRQNDLAAQADDAAGQVRQALAEQQEALVDANARVRTIEASLQAEVDARDAAEAATTLATARAAAIDAGYAPPPESRTAATAIAAAETQLGKPYVYGGSGPDDWDCSGLTQWAYRQAGVSLPRTAAQQYEAVATKVPLGRLEPGDLLFWATDVSDPASIHHVAIYLGNGRMVAAPHTGTVVQIEPVYLDGYFGAVRPG